MSSSNDTLHIGLIGRNPDLPLAAVQRAEAAANHPEIAAAARARIAALPNNPTGIPEAVPAVTPSELITSRDVLAGQLKAVPAPSRPPLPTWARSALTAVGIFAAILLLFKAPVIFNQANYSLHKPAATPAVAAAVIPAEPTITIPKINVHAPVIYEPSVAEANVQKALEGGVVHYGNTAEPGQSGNSVIFGHSSNDWWEPGNYKFVFVLLDKLVPGDRFTVDYQSKRYTYEVTGSKVVIPTDLSVLTQTPEPTMTLITCTPPGTSWKRLVITAKQIDPDPAQATKNNVTSATDSNLPGAAASFWDQLGEAWTGVWHGLTSLVGASPNKTDNSPAPSQLPAIK